MYFTIGLIIAGLFVAALVVFILPKYKYVLKFMAENKFYYETRKKNKGWNNTIEYQWDKRKEVFFIALGIFWFLCFLVWPLVIAIVAGLLAYLYYVKGNEKLMKIIDIIAGEEE